ncbi:GNAT family N-acetyltransferase [Parvicella tangerina]|uniref:Spermidine N(1)-acetyltransferase n=1 Tax=Parvicella tangerina TaxID=2829795 RepID=A0A916JNF1_9FLAO|nr:GNAT family protein [Parvicella tangerina]CAG5084575.1 Spermidine N(1)-acetyltransferase [Parvicella tangerina]
MLENDRIKLRGVEPEDVDYLFMAENDTSLWQVSETLIPFTRHTLQKYAESVHDLHSQGQYRFIIEHIRTGTPVGMIDLFDYNQIHRRAGVGIVVSDKEFLNKGIAKDSLLILLKYAKSVLKLNQLYCSMHASNQISLELFESVGFSRVGERKEWFKTDSGWESELLYQLLLT